MWFNFSLMQPYATQPFKDRIVPLVPGKLLALGRMLAAMPIRQHVLGHCDGTTAHVARGVDVEQDARFRGFNDRNRRKCERPSPSIISQAQEPAKGFAPEPCRTSGTIVVVSSERRTPAGCNPSQMRCTHHRHFPEGDDYAFMMLRS